ncbi:hypothetical protein ACFOOM_00905 [Streptomyces echinoruber]|uniref:Uncharacterized protein n=1 Tax=Streptomyces echinoruber TaxID=68898 RepID=A0A918V6L1_9ACTN|nr:hypothetical protein [Streptomyces echinoruber]GGZ73265.1 hypothetical protein GCM10010389_08530 [Streptomyces echinoruber]
MGCNCGKNKTQYEVVENGRRVFGPTPYKTTAESVAARGAGREVREVTKGAS